MGAGTTGQKGQVSQRQARVERVYRAVVEHKRRSGGDSPTVREIMAATGIRSTSVVSTYLDSLQDAGRLAPVRGGKGWAGGIRVVGGEWHGPQGCVVGARSDDALRGPVAAP